MYTITFGTLSAILMDFVDSNDGLLYLRMAGAEATVNAIWARLVSKEARGKKWKSEVQILVPGRTYPQYVAAVNSMTYRTLRTRLPSGMIDLALLHPMLTVAQDSEVGFYLLTYETDGLPSGFFERLNTCLSLPLKPEWANWLWEQGQQPQTRFILETKTTYENGNPIEQRHLAERTDTPVSQLDGLGSVACYEVQCNGHARDAWLQIIREQLGLGIPLRPHSVQSNRYVNGEWSAHAVQSDETFWQLAHAGEVVIGQAPTLNYLLAQARDEHGLHFVI